MKDIYCIHGKTFKNAMSYIPVAPDFFNHCLAKPVHDVIDFDTLIP